MLQATHGARVVTVSSFGYKCACIDFDNLKSEKGYDAVREYEQSKLADPIFSIELTEELKPKEIKCYQLLHNPEQIAPR